MKKTLLALLLLLLILSPSDKPAKQIDVTQEIIYYRSKVVYEMWTEACFRTRYTCGKLALPNVVRKHLKGGLLGYYNGGQDIVVRRGLIGARLKDVLMHEMVHYIQSKVGGLTVPGPAKQICFAENEAFGVVDQWAFDNKHLRLIVGSDWWKPYSHCWKYYDPNWKTYSIIDRLIWTLKPVTKGFEG